MSSLEAEHSPAALFITCRVRVVHFVWLCRCTLEFVCTRFACQFCTRSERFLTLLHTTVIAATKKTGHCVFIGNLPPKVKRNVLVNLLKPHGTASSLRFRRSNGGQLFNRDRLTATSIIAFVDMETAAEARAAAKALNGHKLGDNVLRADIQAGSKNAGQNDAKRTAFLGNLAFNTTDQVLRKAFESCGKIDYVRLNQSKKGFNGTAFVCFVEAGSVLNALKLNGSDVNGRPVRISRSAAKQEANAAASAGKASSAKAVVEDDDEEEDDDDDESALDDDEDIDEEASDDESELDDDEDDVPAPAPVKKAAKKEAAAPKKSNAPNKTNNKKGNNKKA